MADLAYELNVALNPEHPVPGGAVEVTVHVDNATDEVSSMYASVPDYGLAINLEKKGENLFFTRTCVPWEADPGRYLVTFWGVTTSGESGPRVEVPVTVKYK